MRGFFVYMMNKMLEAPAHAYAWQEWQLVLPARREPVEVEDVLTIVHIRNTRVGLDLGGLADLPSFLHGKV